MICPSISTAYGIQIPPANALLMRSATAVFPVPGNPVRKSERRELITQPNVCSSDSGNTRSWNAWRTVSIDAVLDGIDCSFIMCE